MRAQQNGAGPNYSQMNNTALGQRVQGNNFSPNYPQIAAGSSRSGSSGYSPSRNVQASMQTNYPANSVMSTNTSTNSVMYGTPGAVITGNAQMQTATPKFQATASASSVMHPPIVTPHAVYLDAQVPGEVIGPGQPRSGTRVIYGNVASGQTIQSNSIMTPSGSNMPPPGEVVGPGQMMGSDPDSNDLEGDMMMPHSPDGFTNPYCNNCNGCGGCGYGPAWHGPSGGSCGCQSGNCGCDGGCSDCDSCDSCGEHTPYGRPWILAPFDWFASEVNGCHNGWWWGEDLTVFGGVHDFKNIADNGLVSSFGFQEGVNWGVPVFPDLGITGQVGYEGTQSEFENIDGARLQSFLTVGLFHRPWCESGWDGGVVFDWLHDDFFGDRFDICQIRGQLGWQWNRCNEFGFWFATSVVNDFGFQTLDQYNFFYRRQFCSGGDVRIWGGFTGGNAGGFDGGLVGADFEVPLARRWALDGGFNYFIPTAKPGNGGFSEETWNLGFNIVWYLGGTAQCYNPYRPLFNVADNGSLMTISR
ncbi:MAG TPA: DUF6666 family protein [Pirellulales bacterium]|nr:DUF6666 family protein [Pirellulales bacterium]